jgi:hypothetical protein
MDVSHGSSSCSARVSQCAATLDGPYAELGKKRMLVSYPDCEPIVAHLGFVPFLSRGSVAWRSVTRP